MSGAGQEETKENVNFIKERINADMESGRYDKKVHTRFPPEPNGYLHIGHAKSICLNFGLAQEYHGLCNLRFDDTNPSKEEVEYVESIQEDVRWLGFDWDDRLFYASDYFDQLYDYAIELIKLGLAYVCDLTQEEIREYRGTLKEPGKESPYRNRTIEENLELFEKMRNGEYKEGEKVLRAKIDMNSGNLNMRDPVIYRIQHTEHHRTGANWNIYPMYDFTHCLSDSLEKITHSICTLEFEDHRPLYDWFLDVLKVFHPQQIEFARLNLTYTVMSKRKLLELVNNNYVSGWDDPRMPTISGMRRRGFPPTAIKEFCSRIGVAKRESMIDFAFLEYCIREELNKKATRMMCVLDPLKVVITNYPDGKVEELEADNNPEDEDSGTRMLPFSKEVYIERTDFMEEPPKKYFRLSPGKEVRLKHAYYITCTDVVKDDQGNIVQVNCTYDPESRGGGTKDGRRVKGTLHWVSVNDAVDVEVRLYDHLFTQEDMGNLKKDHDYKDFLNPDSLKVLKNCKAEPALKRAQAGEYFQFLRQGYFSLDSVDSTADQIVFNRSVNLKDSWGKMQKKKNQAKT